MNQKDHIFFNLPNFPKMKLPKHSGSTIFSPKVVTARKSGPAKNVTGRYCHCPIGDVSGFSNSLGLFQVMKRQPPRTVNQKTEADLGVELPGRVGGVLPGKRLCGGRHFETNIFRHHGRWGLVGGDFFAEPLKNGVFFSRKVNGGGWLR